MIPLGILAGKKEVYKNVALNIEPQLSLGAIYTGAMANITKGYRFVSASDPDALSKVVAITPVDVGLSLQPLAQLRYPSSQPLFSVS